MSTTAARDRVREQVRRWANELIDLSKRNNSLYYRPLKRSTLEVVQPSGETLLQWLQAGALDFFLPLPEPARGESAVTAQPPEDEMEVVTNRLTAGDVTKSLSALARQAEADFTDRGLRSLYLCCGLLTWREAEEAEDVRSPLLFVPVTLHRASPRDPYRVSLAEEDPIANLSLQVALAQQYDLLLPNPDFDAVFAGGGLTSYLEEIERIVSERGWSVSLSAGRGTLSAVFLVMAGEGVT